MCRTGFDNGGETLSAGQVRGSDEDESEVDNKASTAIFRSLATHHEDHAASVRECRKLWPYDDLSNLQTVQSHGMVGGHIRLGPAVVEPIDCCPLQVLRVSKFREISTKKGIKAPEVCIRNHQRDRRNCYRQV